MGFYINPKNQFKEEWFQQNMQRFQGRTPPEHHYLKDDDYVACCLFHNGGFTALGIAYCKRELEDFAFLDGRQKFWAYFPYKLVEPYLFGQKVEGRDEQGSSS